MANPLSIFFRFSSSRVASKSNRVFDIIKEGWKNKQSSSAIEKQLKKEGLSYRRINFLEDWRRMGTISRAKETNILGQKRALEYFDKVIEPYRKQEGISFQQALKDIHKWEKNREELIARGDELARRAYEYGFDTSP